MANKSGTTIKKKRRKADEPIIVTGIAGRKVAGKSPPQKTTHSQLVKNKVHKKRDIAMSKNCPHLRADQRP